MLGINLRQIAQKTLEGKNVQKLRRAKEVKERTSAKKSESGKKSRLKSSEKR